MVPMGVLTLDLPGCFRATVAGRDVPGTAAHTHGWHLEPLPSLQACGLPLQLPEAAALASQLGWQWLVAAPAVSRMVSHTLFEVKVAALLHVCWARGLGQRWPAARRGGGLASPIPAFVTY